MAVEITVL